MSEHIEVGAGKTQEFAGNSVDALSDANLASVSGGDKAGSTGVIFLAFTFKLVAVKTVSWAHD